MALIPLFGRLQLGDDSWSCTNFSSSQASEAEGSELKDIERSVDIDFEPQNQLPKVTL